MSRLGNGWAGNIKTPEKRTKRVQVDDAETQATRETALCDVQCPRPPKPRVAGSNPASRASHQPKFEQDSAEGLKSPRLRIRWAPAPSLHSQMFFCPLSPSKGRGGSRPAIRRATPGPSPTVWHDPTAGGRVFLWGRQ